jgi:hypothetical protein
MVFTFSGSFSVAAGCAAGVIDDRMRAFAGARVETE